METSTKVGLGVAGGIGAIALLFGAAIESSEKDKKLTAKLAARREWEASVRAYFSLGREFSGVLKEVCRECCGIKRMNIEVDLGKGYIGVVEIPRCSYSVGEIGVGDSAFKKCLESVHAANGMCTWGWNNGENQGRDITEFVVRSLLGQRVGIVVTKVTFGDWGEDVEITFNCPEIQRRIDAQVESVKSVVAEFMRVRNVEAGRLSSGGIIKGRIIVESAEGQASRFRLESDDVRTYSLTLLYNDKSLGNHVLLRPEVYRPQYNPFETRWERKERLRLMKESYDWRRHAIAAGLVCNLKDDVLAAMEGEHEFCVESVDHVAHVVFLSSKGVDTCIKNALAERCHAKVRAMAKVPLLIDGSNLLLLDKALGWKSVRTLVRCLNEMRVEFHLYFDASIWAKLEELGAKGGVLFVKHMIDTDRSRVKIVPSGTQADDFILQRANAEGNHILSHDKYRQQEYRELYPWLDNLKESGDKRLHRFDVVNGMLTIPDLYIYEKVA